MGIISLKEYKKTLHKDVLKQAEKMIVRELDEVKPNQYESYVDDGSDSFDVAISINKAGVIIKSTCDCEDGNKTFCVHKTAVLISIAEKRKVGSKTVRVKVNPLQLLINETDVHKLKDWVWELLQKNKDLQMAFTHQFSAKPQIFLPLEIIKITNDATKAVSRSRKNLEISELKKLVDLWEGIHHPIINQYLTDLTNKSYFQNVHVLLDTIMLFKSNINTNSVKINNYIVEILKKIADAVKLLINDDAWLIAINYFVHKSDDNLQLLNNEYFRFLLSLVEEENADRKKQLIILLANTQKKSLFVGSSFLMARQEAILDLIITAGLFKDYAEMFKPQRYENTYNLKLIKRLIELESLILAEKFCKEQIASNYYEQYNVPYLVLLKEIYKISKEEKKLNELRIKLLPITFEVEDYLEVSKSFIDDSARREFRTSILTKAKKAAQNNRHDASSLCFSILNDDKSYSKMIGLINSYTSFTLINLYFVKMFEANKELLLKTLLDRREESWRNIDGEFKESYISILYQLMKIHYTENFLEAALKEYCKKPYYNNTRLVSFLNKAIEEDGKVK